MSILATSPTSTRHFDMTIAEALGDVNAAVIVQQLDYWMQKEGVGVVIDGIKYIYNTYADWTSQQFRWLTSWQFRKSMNLLRSLSIVKAIRYKSKQWNQTNYYSLDRDRLAEFINLEMAVNLEISEMCNTPAQDENNQTLKVRSCDISLYEPKITTKERTTKQRGDRTSNESESIAAATSKEALKVKENQKDSVPHSAELNASVGQKKVKSEATQSDSCKETNVAEVDYIVNKNWKSLISLLDSTGVPINKTVINLLKLYPKEKVEGAIALLKVRKREKHIPNLSGYFVSALKGDWVRQNIVDSQSGDCQVDKAVVFRHWYDLARELGYCSGTEMREGEQWINLSGSWEQWEAAVKRGYSLEYLKKIMKRNNGN
ncbi:MAG: hypothetical protein HC939_24725 [Pleurocapsa sp. SU_5_0]|nr:hypothetical protein [Pleurocapsa sp. SU_5_0]NJO99242.1 hypothetical protein [Pleurocapsa sp. CRU_1_2]